MSLTRPLQRAAGNGLSLKDCSNYVEDEKPTTLEIIISRASVMRDGEVCEIDAEEVVPGDVVSLESGNRVPADLRLMRTHNLEVDESLLTGNR